MYDGKNMKIYHIDKHIHAKICTYYMPIVLVQLFVSCQVSCVKDYIYVLGCVNNITTRRIASGSDAFYTTDET